VENYYSNLRFWTRLVAKLKVPPPLSNFLVATLFPKLNQKIQDPQHVLTAMSMYG